jgi:ribosomal-protein-alanine N-acetyltransferase
MVKVKFNILKKEGKMQSFSFRPATEEDLPGVLALEKVSYPLPWNEQQFKEEMLKPFCRFWVYTDDETDAQIAGYIVFWIMFEDCHILNVTVGLGWRGLGFGERMVRKALNEALKKDCKKIMLEVRKSNAGAMALYSKLGFFTEQIKKGYYSDGEDAHVMMLYLQTKNTF